MRSNGEKVIETDGIKICTESFGSPEYPAILLIMGATASMIWWDDEFCSRLARGDRFVIRYDNRDVGRSAIYEPGTINYNVMDMVQDAFNVLDAYGIKKAHFAGMSLGGMLAQIAAIVNPDRVESLTLISSSIWDDRPDLPATVDEILEFHKRGAAVDWSDESQIISYMVDGNRMLNGSAHPFDEKRSVILSEREIKRAGNLLSMFNHALLSGGEELYGKSSSINKPVLIIHGTEDPILPFPHALALKDTIRGSELLVMEGSGHEIHSADWDNIINSILRITSLKN